MDPADSAAQPPTIQVEVAFSPAPRQVELLALVLPQGSSVKDALSLAGLLERVQGLSLGIWGRRTTLAHVLRDRDRVEAYRELTVDPKEARRLRYRAHGEKIPRGTRRPKIKFAPEASN